jgi:hypothetical protein
MAKHIAGPNMCLTVEFSYQLVWHLFNSSFNDPRRDGIPIWDSTLTRYAHGILWILGCHEAHTQTGAQYTTYQEINLNV